MITLYFTGTEQPHEFCTADNTKLIFAHNHDQLTRLHPQGKGGPKGYCVETSQISLADAES